MIASIMHHAAFGRWHTACGSIATSGSVHRLPQQSRMPWAITVRSLAVACLMAMLPGCFGPSQKAFEKEVHTLARPGMPVSAAVARLTSHGFDCAGVPINCSRIRPGPLIASCVEHVNLEAAGQSSALLSVAIPPIACTGL